MPKYTLPPMKKPKKDDKLNMPTEATGMGEYERCIDLPVNAAILDAVDTGIIELEEALLPYLLLGGSKTLYEEVKSQLGTGMNITLRQLPPG